MTVHCLQKHLKYVHCVIMWNADSLLSSACYDDDCDCDDDDCSMEVPPTKMSAMELETAKENATVCGSRP